ncbi:MAG: hypothetical protein IPK32_15855 [Verrucomicrobiaceae bacterium]|nr:hypothetical protein [Verrucomicrobiaceae bacterium]
MKTYALTALTALLILPSCYNMFPPPGPPRPPAYGQRGYPLDRGPGDRRYGMEEAPTPRDTRYLDAYGEPDAPPSTRNIPREDTANVQPPGQEMSIDPPEVITKPGLSDGGTKPPSPIIVTPPDSSRPTVKTPEVAKPKMEPIAPPPTPKPPTTNSGLTTAKRSKPGFVKSPFDPLGRDIDVSDFRSGQKARCPYTQKIFVVP